MAARGAERPRAELVLGGGSICERARKKLLTRINTSRRGSHESPRFDHSTNVVTWYVAVTFGVNGTLLRKTTSVERSKTDKKVDSSKFELERGVRNQYFFC